MLRKYTALLEAFSLGFKESLKALFHRPIANPVAQATGLN